jgi:hypothetical protein
VSFDFLDLIPDPLPLLLYVLRLIIEHLYVLLLLVPVLILLFKEVLDLPEFCAVDDALLDLPFLLLYF